ncbi:MAG: hypothetical protein ABI356_12010 [Steroidobacteraceae bacterium]
MQHGSAEATYWGEERDRRFKILVDGAIMTNEELSGTGPSEFIERNYAISPALTNAKTVLRFRFEPETGFSTGPSSWALKARSSNCAFRKARALSTPDLAKWPYSWRIS